MTTDPQPDAIDALENPADCDGCVQRMPPPTWPELAAAVFRRNWRGWRVDFRRSGGAVELVR